MRQHEVEHDEVEPAARERTTTLTSYDFSRLDQDFAAVLETATGPFEAEYRTTSEQLRATFTQSKAVATGSVLAAGIEELQERRAVAVVAVDFALPGDPAGALLTVAPLRALGPHADSIGSAAPAVLLGRAGGRVIGVAVMMELAGLGGRAALEAAGVTATTAIRLA